VKTTQPRRYLVRPNQGLVAPGSSETISIMLVDKDKQILLQSYDRLGQSALDQSKDKFLVQSCSASKEFATRFMAAKSKVDSSEKTAKELSDALTSMWNTVSTGSSVPVYNKKLQVRHVVPQEGPPKPAAAAQPAASASQQLKSLTDGNQNSHPSVENMTPEQMYAEVTSLRRKYDELVAFSVNLTSERDTLNNALEQTKRDLNRELVARKEDEKQGASSSTQGRGGATAQAQPAGFTITQILVIAFACYLAGIRGANNGSVGLLKAIPIIGGLLGFKAE